MNKSFDQTILSAAKRIEEKETKFDDFLHFKWNRFQLVDDISIN